MIFLFAFKSNVAKCTKGMNAGSHLKLTLGLIWIGADRAELLRGPLYYVLVLLGATLFFWRESPVGVVSFISHDFT